jgi:hypothetical protein
MINTALKTVSVDFTKPTKKPKEEKVIKPREPPKKRVVTETEKWTTKYMQLMDGKTFTQNRQICEFHTT